ncbi:MAG TPA: cytochrome b/b6 domain-containing protein [Ramlibacter sp.]
MNTVSASRAERPRTLVWDAPVRVFHWLLVACFATAWLTSESERWQLVHITAGYTMAGLVAFRVLWGLVGTRHARFSDFVRGPRAVAAYFGSLLRRRPEHHAGHNPAGALAILALLLLAVFTTATGWANYNEIGGKEAFEDLHEGLATVMLALVIVHVLAVALSSKLHHENLVAAMIHGRKPVPASEGIRTPWRSVAVVLLAGVLGFWWLQWQSAPVQEVSASQRVEAGDDD